MNGTNDLLLADERSAAATLAAWLATKSDRTASEYTKCLNAFAAFVGFPSGAAAVEALLKLPRGEAARGVEMWKGRMLQDDLSSATINQRLSAVRSFVEAARRHGLVDWALDVDGAENEARRDSRGPAWADYERMAGAEPSARNRAILRLLGDRGLRRSEVEALDLEDVGAGEVLVRGKGRREKEALTVNTRTAEALEAWIRERGREPGSLFGVTDDRIHAIVVAAGRRVGVTARPHGLRHTAVTRALDLTDGDVRKVRGFSRHAKVETVLRYDDARRNHAGEVANLVGAAS